VTSRRARHIADACPERKQTTRRVRLPLVGVASARLHLDPAVRDLDAIFAGVFELPGD